MNRILTAIFLIVALASVTFAQTATVRTLDSLTRLGPVGVPPGSTSITQILGRGETGSSQINVAATGGSVTITGLSTTGLSGPSGHTIPSSAFTFSREFYTTVTGTANYGGGSNPPLGSGTYPEALIPFNDPETGVALGTGNSINAASFVLSAGQNQPYWIDVSVPRGTSNTPPGTYTGIIVVATSAGTVNVPMTLNIQNLELPLTPTEVSEMSQWAPASGNTVASISQAAMRNKQMNWYVDAAAAAGYRTTYGLNRSGLDAYQFVESSSCGTYPSVPSSGTITGYAANFPSGLPLDFYVADELNGCTGAISFLQSMGNAAHGATPPVKTIATWNNVTSSPQSSLQGYIDHWALLISQEQWPTLPYAGQGDLWSYSSCNTGNGNTPEWLLDYGPINERQQAGFIGWSEGQVGLLYSRMDGWTTGNAVGSYTNMDRSNCMTGSGPGDSMLVYPPGPIGSSEPAPGIRMKALRDGFQDWELAKMLSGLGGGAFVTAQLAGGVSTSWTSFTKLPATLIAAHDNIEAQISSINTPATVSPAVYALDLVSGPNSGGESNNGTILTIDGNNFGATQSTSSVTVGGGAVATYKTWSNTKIQVAIGASAVSGAVSVRVGGLNSTCENHDDGCNFTVRSGSIFYVSPTGSDAANGAFATPWLTATHAVNTMTAGSIVYYMNGFIVTAPDGTGWHAALLISTGHGAPTCLVTTPCAMVAYPGATATFGSLTPVSGSGDTTIYGIRTDGTTSNWDILGLKVRGPNCAYSITGGTNWRTINLDVQATDTGAQQCGAGDYENLTTAYVYGNNFHNSGASNKQGHTVYFTTNVNSVFMGWNQVVSNTTCYDVQFHSSSAPDQFDLHVHDNYFTGNPCAAINFATVDPSKGVVEAYNNVMWKSGNGPVPTGGSSDFACIYMAGILNAGSAPTGTVQVYNNTMRDCGSQNTGRWGAVLIADQGSGSGIHYNFTNNITSLAANELYFGFDGTASSSYVTCSGGNLFFNGGATPSYCNTTAVNADPQFISTTIPNLNLQATSPAIAAGSSAHVPVYDFNGLLRPSPPAMGAYELAGTSSVTIGVPLAPLLTMLRVQ